MTGTSGNIHIYQTGRFLVGGRTDAGNGGRRMHAAWGAELSGGCWRVVGVEDIQVDGVSRQERR